RTGGQLMAALRRRENHPIPGGSGHVTSYGAPGCWGTSRRAWRYACHCSRVVPAGSGASGSMIQSVSAKRRLRSARREAHAWASRCASISAGVRQRISATDDHLQVVGPEPSPRVQRDLVILRRLIVLRQRASRDGPQERHMQFAVHAAGCEHRAGVKCADDFCGLAVWQVCEIENISRTVDRRCHALVIKGIDDMRIRPLWQVGDAHYFHLPMAIHPTSVFGIAPDPNRDTRTLKLPA